MPLSTQFILQDHILTPAMDELLPFLAVGMSDNEIAEALHMKLRTVETVVFRLCRATGVRGRRLPLWAEAFCSRHVLVGAGPPAASFEVLLEHKAAATLSHRFLYCLSWGLSNQEIAVELSTAKWAIAARLDAFHAETGIKGRRTPLWARQHLSCCVN